MYLGIFILLIFSETPIFIYVTLSLLIFSIFVYFCSPSNGGVAKDAKVEPSKTGEYRHGFESPNRAIHCSDPRVLLRKNTTTLPSMHTVNIPFGLPRGTYSHFPGQLGTGEREIPRLLRDAGLWLRIDFYPGNPKSHNDPPFRVLAQVSSQNQWPTVVCSCQRLCSENYFQSFMYLWKLGTLSLGLANVAIKQQNPSRMVLRI